MNRQKAKGIDVTMMPGGLTRQEFIRQPALKSVRSWFIWAGIVEIVTGAALLAQIALYWGDPNYIIPGYLYPVAFLEIVLGIALLVTKSPGVANAVGITGFIWIVFVLITGGSVGLGFIAIILAVAGASKCNKAWKEYQSNRMNFGM